MPIEKNQRSKPKSKVRTRTTAKIESLEKEVNDLSLAIEDLHEDIRKMLPKSAGRRMLNNLGSGILKGLGFIIGTTIIAALFIFLIQKALQTDVVQSWISDQISSAVEASVDKAVDNTIGDFNLPFFGE